MCHLLLLSPCFPLPYLSSSFPGLSSLPNLNIISLLESIHFLHPWNLLNSSFLVQMLFCVLDTLFLRFSFSPPTPLSLPPSFVHENRTPIKKPFTPCFSVPFLTLFVVPPLRPPSPFCCCFPYHVLLLIYQ